jgi:hypothetical protein
MSRGGSGGGEPLLFAALIICVISLSFVPLQLRMMDERDARRSSPTPHVEVRVSPSATPR